MKTRLLTIVLLFICFLGYSQTSIDASGIAIQGIARDNNNTARTNADITLTFELYYIDGPQERPVIIPDNANLTTDSFGVFSYVLDPGPEYNAIIANHQVWLRISEGSTVISNEKLKHVPYAIAANNGVPSGSIIPFIGNQAPAGWVLCDGAPLPTDGSADYLIALLGSNNAPNLQGMFLRGTGTSPVNNQAGPALMATQEDQNKEHNHGAGSLITDTKGSHNHANGAYDNVLKYDGQHTIDGPSTDATSSSEREPNLRSSRPMNNAGAHEHNVLGNTAFAGELESRPVNYGVNYIIKL